MIDLTREDWSEIYYAIEAKSQALKEGRFQPEDQPGEDARWIAQLSAISGKIGPDGNVASKEGVARNK